MKSQKKTNKQTSITKKQQAILLLIPRYRFLSSSNIQSFLKHKYRREINRWLTDLTEKGYVRRIYDNTIIGKNRVPAIYFLDNNGIRFIKQKGIYDKNFIHKLYWDKTRSDSFIEHQLLIATVCAELESKSGIPIAAIVSAQNFQELQKIKQKRKNDYTLINSMRAAFEDQTPEQVQHGVANAIAQVRHERKQAKTDMK